MPTPQLTEFEEKLLAMGKEVDASNDEVLHEDFSENADSQPDKVEPEPPTETEPEEKQEETTAEEKAQNEKPESAETAPEKKEEEVSEYQKALKEKRDREARAWQKIEAEKAEVARQKAEIEELRSKLQQQTPPPKPKPFKDDEGFSAQDYASAAKNFDAKAKEAEDGADYTQAEQLRTLAKQAMHRAQQVQQLEVQHRQQTFSNEWAKHVNEMLDKEPILKDVNAPLSREVARVLREYPEFSTRPDGFKRALAFAQSNTKAESVSALQAENLKLTKEIEALKKRTAIPPTPPARRSGTNPDRPKTAADLLAMAEEHDRQLSIR